MPHNNWDKYLDPPDEIEGQDCEYCGQEMELCTKGYTRFECVNPFCPSKFNEAGEFPGSIVCEMSEHLAEVEQELADTKLKLKSKQHALDVISRITPSTDNVVVRDTEYQIRRMEDSLECLKECSDWDNFYEEFALVEQEWAEVKKILASYG